MKILRKLFAVVACVALLLPIASARADTGSGLSSNISVDTRNLTMTGLVVTGPSSIPWGSEAAYTATLSLAGASAQDVTVECEWSVSGGPQVSNWWELPVMSWNILTPHVPSATPVLVRASITRNTGRIVSAPFPVTILESNDMNIGIGLMRPTVTGPVYVRTEGSNFVWQIAAEARGLATDQPGVTYQWSIGGQPVLTTSSSFNTEFTGTPGTRQLRVVATDSQNRTGESYRALVFDAPPAAGEPPVLIPALDPGFGEFIDENGDPFAFDPLKTPNGLIVLTHGLYEDADAAWLRTMASAIRVRLTNEGKPLPNIAIFAWGDLSDPTKYWGFDEARDKAIDRADSALTGLPIIATSFAVGFVADCILVRPHGQSEGQELADWVRTEINRGNIVTYNPLHLIGHSAGGFVVGECGWQLRNTWGDLRVTMLDTPFPITNHLWPFPAPTRKLDRYVSSFFGTLQYPWTAAASLFNALSADMHFSLLARPSPPAGGLILTIGAHSYSHEWYESTVVNGAIGAAGFGLSPFLASPAPAPPFPDEPGAAGMFASAPPPPPVETTVPITGFATFGNVTPDAQGYVLTEGASQNAGLTLAAYSFPAGTHTLRFNFRFTTPGDGDFLSVSFGDNPPIFLGKDMPLTRDAELTADVPVDDVAGAPGDLVFRLVSRGSQNAVVTIHGIVAVTAEDVDQDGLTNAAEVALGTNPMKADTDGDGVRDADEVNIYLTNPLLADTDGDGSSDGAELAAGTDPKNPASRLAITSAAFAPTGFTLRWPAQTSRKYRVLRSATPEFESYENIGLALPGVSPVQSFTDTAVLPGQVPQKFYRIQLEPQP